MAGRRTTTASPDHSNAQGCVTWFIAANAAGHPMHEQTQSGASPPTPGAARAIHGHGSGGGQREQRLTALTWAELKPGTYLLESGTHPSIQVPMGLIGMLVVTTAPSGATAGHSLSRGAALRLRRFRVRTTRKSHSSSVKSTPCRTKRLTWLSGPPDFSETMVWSGLPTSPQGTPGCGYPGSSAYHQCYPPAVNYTPFYYLINGLAFDKTNPAHSLFAATAGVSGTPTAGHDRNHRHRPGAPGECRPAHARAVDRRIANDRVSTGQVRLPRWVDSP